MSNLSKLDNKIDSSTSSSIFASRPISPLLSPIAQREVQASTLKLGKSLAINPKLFEQHSSSFNSFVVLVKLSSMENKMTSIIESRIISLEKMEACEKQLHVLETHIISIMKAVESISTIVEEQMVSKLFLVILNKSYF